MKIFSTLILSILAVSFSYVGISKDNVQEKTREEKIRNNDEVIRKIRKCKTNCKFNASMKLRFVENKMPSLDEFEIEGAVFDSSNLHNFSWNNGKLKNVKFVKTPMRDSSFDSSILENVSFEIIGEIPYVSFKSAKLRNVSFQNSAVENLNLENAEIKDSNFEGLVYSDSLSFWGAKISNSVFKDMHFEESLTLTDAKIEKSNFYRARFDDLSSVGLVISNSDFRETRFTDAPLIDVISSKFNNSIIEGKSDPGYLRCKDSDFSGLIVKAKNFSISTSDGCNFTNADLSVVELSSPQFIKNTNFCNAKMPDGKIGKCPP